MKITESQKLLLKYAEHLGIEKGLRRLFKQQKSEGGMTPFARIILSSKIKWHKKRRKTYMQEAEREFMEEGGYTKWIDDMFFRFYMYMQRERCTDAARIYVTLSDKVPGNHPVFNKIVVLTDTYDKTIGILNNAKYVRKRRADKARGNRN
jgi:hypothetical protein